MAPNKHQIVEYIISAKYSFIWTLFFKIFDIPYITNFRVLENADEEITNDNTGSDGIFLESSFSFLTHTDLMRMSPKKWLIFSFVSFYTSGA